MRNDSTNHVKLSSYEIVEQFRDEMRKSGVPCNVPIVADGEFQRFKSDGDRKPDAWYILHDSGVPHGSFGHWKHAITGNWSAYRAESLTPAQRAQYQRQLAKQQEAIQAERDRRHQEQAEEAKRILQRADPATNHHPYLKAKRVRAHPGVKVGNWKQRQAVNCLLIPLTDVDGNLTTLEAIAPDKFPSGTNKEWLAGGKKNGSFFSFGDLASSDTIYIGEGYSTMASSFEATGIPCAMAGDRTNLLAVGQALREKFPEKRLVFLADNDRKTAGNPGLTDANKAAEAVSGIVVYPEFADGEPGTDFNDYAAIYGPEAVRDAIEKKIKSFSFKPAQPALLYESITYSVQTCTKHAQNAGLEAQTCTITITPPNLERTGDDGRVRLEVDSVAAIRLADALRGHLALCPQSGIWFAFVGDHWAALLPSQFSELITQLIYAGAPAGFSHARLNGMVSLIERGLLRLPATAHANNWIPFTNGLLDYRTKRLQPVTADNALTWVLPYAYDADADCPTVKSWLHQAVDGDRETVEFLRAWLNAVITGRSDLQKFLNLLGPGGTGKGVFTRLASALVGSANVAVTDLKNLETNRFETANLHEKRLALITEVARYGGDVTVLKALTGQDALRLERKYQNADGHFIFCGMVMLSGNEPFQTTDSTGALERRRLTVEFNRRPPASEIADWRRRGGERAVLHAELPGVVNWVLELSREEVTRRLMHPPQRTVAANIEAMRADNVLADWLMDSCVPDDTSKVQIGNGRCQRENGRVVYDHATERLYPHFLAWCDTSGKKHISHIRFSNNLITTCAALNISATKTRSSKGYQMEGIRLRRDNEEIYDYAQHARDKGEDFAAMGAGCAGLEPVSAGLSAGLDSAKPLNNKDEVGGVV